MAEFSLERLYTIMRDVFMLHDFEIHPSMSAKDVPGWDSLNHSILMMELSAETGVDLSPEATAQLGSIGELYALVVERCRQDK